uniref:Uncharacterized protein n=1 Tax=Oryza meridionalis TaxID=40149 RepID=A0A0E0EQF3_9ORYZ
MAVWQPRAAACPHGDAARPRHPGCRRGALRGKVGGRARQPNDGGAGGLRWSRSSSSVTGVGASQDGSVKGAGGGGSSSSLPVGTLAPSGAPPLFCGEFLDWIEAAARQRGEAQVAKAMPSSPRFSFGQIWRGGWWVVEWRGPEPALRGGGSMKSADGRASVRCGGCCMLPYVCVGFLSWWTAICSQGCRVSGESLVRWFTGPAAATPLGVVTSLGYCRGLPSPLLDELLWVKTTSFYMGDGSILGCRDHHGGIVFGASSLWCCRRPSGVRPRLAGIVWC